MNKLIPLSEYVLQEEKTLENIPNSNLHAIKIAASYGSVIRYTKFLRQPLTLSMFVPVDDNGNVLEKPKLNEGYVHEVSQNLTEYYQAKRMVLFEGFYHESFHAVFNDELKVRIFLNIYQFMVEDSLGYGGGNLNGETLEDLANAGLRLPLTPSALKRYEKNGI